MRAIRYILEYIFFRIFVGVLGRVRYPEGKERTARRMAKLLWAVGGRAVRGQVTANLEIAMPHLAVDEREAMARRAVENSVEGLIEFLQAGKADRAWVEKYIQWDPASRTLLQEREDSGEGTILLTAHIGSWELILHAYPVFFRKQLHAIGAPVKNPYVDRVVQPMRRRFGVDIIFRGETGPDFLRALKKGDPIILAGDQNAGGRGLFIPFFGKPASTHKGPATLAYHSRALVVFLVVLRLPGGYFRVEAVPLGRVEKGKASEKDDTILRFTLRWVDLLEKYIRKYPEQYFWLHNRWKKRPEADTVIHPRVLTDLSPLPYK